MNHSDEGLTLETSAFFTLNGGKSTFSTQLFTLNYLLYSPTDTTPQFLERLSPFIETMVRVYVRGVDVFGPNSARVKMTLKGIKTYLCPRTCFKLYYYYYHLGRCGAIINWKKMSTTQCKQSYACASTLNDILACQNLYCGSQNVPQHAT